MGWKRGLVTSLPSNPVSWKTKWRKKIEFVQSVMSFSPCKQHFVSVMASHSSTRGIHSSAPTEKVGIIGDHAVPRSHVKSESPRSSFKTDKEESSMASDLFCQQMGTMINKHDVQSILNKQTETMMKFEKTNAKFARFNDLSSARYLYLNQQLKSHTKMLLDMKKDLDSVFRRIRNLKTKLEKQYGPAFHATSAGIQKLAEELGASIENEDSASLSTLTESKEFSSDSQSTNQGLAVMNAGQDIIQQKTEEDISQGSDHSTENKTATITETEMQAQGNDNRSPVNKVMSRTEDTDNITTTVNTNDVNQAVDTCRTVDAGDTVQTVDTSDKTETVDTDHTYQTVETGDTVQTVDKGHTTETVYPDHTYQTVDTCDTVQTLDTSDIHQTQGIGDSQHGSN